MLKDTRLLIGLGIGLIAGAILLQLMNLAITGVNDDFALVDNVVDESSYNLELLEDVASTLDYHIIKKSDVFYTQAEMDEAIEAARNGITEQPDEPIEENAGELPAVVETVVEPVVEPDVAPVVEAIEAYRVIITSGMVTEQVTSLLLQVGLIDDGDAFKAELSRRKLNNMIQIGEFEFNEKPNLTKLIDTITTRR